MNRMQFTRMAHVCGAWLAVSALLAGLVPAAESEPERAAAPAVFSDMPSAPPERVISMAAHVTEMLFALGVGDRLVGVGEGSEWPAEAAALPNLGGALDPDPDFDRIAALKPDLVFLTKSHALYYRELNRRGIRTLTVTTDSINDALWTLRGLSEIMDRVEAAKPLAAKLVEDVNRLIAEGQKREPRRTLLSVGHDSRSLDLVFAATPDNYLGDILRAAGGRNIIEPAKTPEEAVVIQPLTTAQIRDAQPEIIIDLVYGDKPDGAEIRRREGMWRELFSASAFRPYRVYVIHEPYLGVPGMNMPKSISTLARLIFPEG